MKKTATQLALYSEIRQHKLNVKNFKRAVRLMWQEAFKAAFRGETRAVLYKNCYNNLEELQNYFELKGFYIRKYRFGEPNEYLEIAWGKGIEEQRHLDECQLKIIEWLKEKDEE